MKAFLIRLLLRLIDVPEGKKEDEKKVNQWLSESWQHPGFSKYVSDRLRTINRELSGGVGLVERTRPDYTRMIGQKFEVLRLGNEIKKAFQEAERKKKEQLKA